MQPCACDRRANTDGTTSLKINFDGWSDTYDYWALSDSSDLFPVGYCEWESLKLQAPKGFDGDFKWQSYLSSTGTVAVPEDLLPGSGTGVRQGDLQVESKAVETAESATETAAAVEEIAGFVVGMRLEAVDRQNLSLTAVANIAEIRSVAGYAVRKIMMV